MILLTIFVFTILALFIVILTMARQPKPPELVPQYLVVPAPETRATNPLRLPFILVVLAVTAMLTIYFFSSYEVDLTTDQNVLPEPEKAEQERPDEPAEELAVFQYGP